MTERIVKKGEFACRVGGPPDNWYGVLDGLVKMSIATPDGSEVVFLVVSSGGWFGEGTLLKTEKRRYDIVALRTTRMALMPRSDFMWLVENSPTFDRFLLDQFNARLGQQFASLARGRSESAVARVAHSLADLFHPDLYPHAGPMIQLSQEEVGHLAGLSRQHAHEALHVLERDGIIKVSYGQVTILDLQKLLTYAATRRKV